MATRRQHSSLNSLVWFLFNLFSLIRIELYIQSLEKLTYGVVRWNGCIPYSPLSHSHVNVLGRYNFELDESLVERGLRPLRDPTDIDEYEIFVGP